MWVCKGGGQDSEMNLEWCFHGRMEGGGWEVSRVEVLAEISVDYFVLSV